MAAITRFISLVDKMPSHTHNFTTIVCKLFVAMVMTAVGGLSAHANDGVSGLEINELVKSTLAVNGMNSTPRLNPDREFLPCENDLTVEKMFGGWSTVKVKCAGKNGWQTMVRTGFISDTRGSRGSSAPIPASLASVSERNVAPAKPRKKEFVTIMTLGRSMSRGETITPDDVVPMDFEKHSVASAFFNANDVIGRRLKTRLSAHKAILSHHLLPNWMVEEKDEVNIISQTGGIIVAMVGFATENGQYGDWVKVENASSGKIVIGQVTGEKKITIKTNIR